MGNGWSIHAVCQPRYAKGPVILVLIRPVDFNLVTAFLIPEAVLIINCSKTRTDLNVQLVAHLCTIGQSVSLETF